MSYTLTDIEVELKKNPDLKKEHFLAFKDWVEKQPHLPQINDVMLFALLQACYFSNEAAKRAIDNFATIRTHAPEIFANRDPIKLKDHMDAVMYAMLPNKTDQGYKVLFSKIVDSNTDRYVCNEQVKIYDMAATVEILSNGTNDGMLALMDMKGCQIGHLARMNILVMRKFLFYVQEGIPIRLKGIHIMNALPFVDKFIALVKPFLKSEMLNILHIHTGMDTLLKVIPKECLPNEYGGTGGTLEELQRHGNDKILQYRDYFLEDEKLIVDESKRPGKPKDVNTLFGVEGTFKKLSID